MAQLGEDKKVSNNLISEIKTFVEENFCIETSALDELSLEEQTNFLRSCLLYTSRCV